MEIKTFVTIAVGGGKMICSPIVCFCETHEHAHSLATAKMALMPDPPPRDTVLHTFDTETDMLYANAPPEMKEQDERGADGDSPADGFPACHCPANSNCVHAHFPTGTCRYTEDAGSQCDACQAKPCADFGGGQVPGIPEEGRVYGPDELLFAIGPYDHCDQIPDLKFVVYFTIADDFEKTGHQTDDMGGHNIDGDALRAAGLCDAELMESVFEVNPLKGDTREALAMRLLDAGFGFRQAFQDFMDGCREGDR
jgi:hypothetical protein